MKNLFLGFLLVCFVLPAHSQKLKSRGNSFNPDIGVNALFEAQASERNTDNDGLNFKHMELQFHSDVDAYLTSWILLGIEEEEGEHHIHPEEAYVETLSLPHVTLRVGKSKLPMGKHNQLHRHAFPFINAPLINEKVLGEESFAETGVGASVLVPLPWFSEFELFAVQGKSEELFNSDHNDDKVVLSHYKNLWELSPSLTFEWGMSGAAGKNSDHLSTYLYGTDLTFKWRPLRQGRYRSFEWSTEFLQKNRKGEEDGKLAGMFSYFKYQLAKRWYVQYRYDHTGLNSSRSESINRRHTVLAAFLPSEFSAIRFQLEHRNDGHQEDEKRAIAQLNISIGAHPAHAY